MSMKSINAKLRRMFEKYGSNFGAYSKQAAIIARNFSYHWTKSGAIQIDTGKANANLNQFQKNALQDLEKSASLDSLRKAAAQSLRDEGKRATAKAVEERLKKKDYIERNQDKINHISDQVKSGKTPSAAEQKLYDRLSNRTEDIGYDELYDLIHTAVGDKGI